MHVMLDIGGSEKLVDEKWTEHNARAFIEEAVTITGLMLVETPWPNPMVVDTPYVLYAHALIAESHIYAELRRLDRAGFVDVFSCKELNPRKVADCTAKWFGAQEGFVGQMHVLPRTALTPATIEVQGMSPGEPCPF